MPVSVQTPEDPKPVTVPSPRRQCLRPGLRVAAVLAAIGGMTSAASGQDQTFDGGAGDESSFNDPLNWLNDVDPGSDLGGDAIVFDFDDPSIDPFTILVGQAILGIGDLDNTADGIDIVFSDDGGGSFQFVGGSVINPGAGSFTFDLDVTALGDMTFNLIDGDVVFNQAFTTNGGSITANDGTLEFNGAVTSGEGTTWISSTGGFTFDSTFTANGQATFDLLGGGQVDFNDAVTFNTGIDPLTDFATFNGGIVNFTGDVTVADGYGFTFDNGNATNFVGDIAFDGSHSLVFEDTTATDELARVIFGGDIAFADGASLLISGGDFSEDDPTVASANFAGDMTFGGDFTLTMNGQQTVDFDGDMSFVEGKTFTINGDENGTVRLDGASTFAGAFSLLVNGDGDQTVNWTGNTEFGGDFLLDTRGGGDADVTFGGIRSFSLASGIDEMDMFIVTDGDSDSVSINGRAFNVGSFNLLVGWDGTTVDGDDDPVGVESAMTLIGGTISGATNLTVDLSLYAGSTFNLGSLDPDTPLANKNEWVLNSINDGDTGSGTLNLAGNFDGQVFLRGGEFSGAITEDNNASLTVSWTQNESRFTGDATISGAYQARNGATHRIGRFGDDADAATITGISALEIIQGTMYVENATITTDTDGTLTLQSAATSAAALVIENDSTVTIDGNFDMAQAASMLMITGNSDSGINLDIGGTSTINGMVEVSAESNGTANANFQGDATLAGSLMQSNSSKVDFGADLAIESGGQWLLEDTSSATVAGNLDLQTGSGLELEDGTTLDVTGDFTASGLSTIEAGATLNAGNLVLGDGAVMALVDNNLVDGKKVLLDIGGEVKIESGAMLYGTGQIEIDDEFLLESGGTLMSGAIGTTEGLLEISGGNLEVDSGSTIQFGVNGDIAQATNGVGQSSIITVQDDVIFETGSTLEVAVQQGAYIPTAPSQGIAGSLEFVLMEADNFNNTNGIDLQAGAPSVTREWIFTVEDNAGSPDRILASSTADYTNTLSGSQLVIGGLLNSFREPANFDPTGSYGLILGNLDSIETAAAYQAAIVGFEPTAQISAIQTAALSQYHDVLRNEIRRRFTLVERRTPAPFRLGEPYQLAGQEEVVERSIRRQVRSNPTAESFGAFWTRELRTPALGDIVGFDGNEYGGLGGFGWRLDDDWTVGVDVGYSAFVGNLNGGYGDTRIGTLRGGGFLTWGSGDGLFFDAALSGGWNSFTFNRSVPNTDLGNTSNGDGFQFDGTFGTGYRMELSEGLAFTPNGSFLYSYISTGNVDEEYSGPTTAAALAIDPGDLSSFVGRIGADLSWSALPGFVIDGQLGWQGNFTDNGNYTVGLVGPGASVPVTVDNQTINTAYYGVGLNWDVLEQIDLNLRWEGRSGDGVNSQMFTGGITISF